MDVIPLLEFDESDVMLELELEKDTAADGNDLDMLEGEVLLEARSTLSLGNMFVVGDILPEVSSNDAEDVPVLPNAVETDEEEVGTALGTTELEKCIEASQDNRH